MHPRSQPSHDARTPHTPRKTAPNEREQQADAKYDLSAQMFDKYMIYGSAGGAGLGALYGAIMGTWIASLIGMLIGAGVGMVIGAVLGLIVGIVGGALLTLLTVCWFMPLRSPLRYRLTTGLVGASVTALAGLASLQLLGSDNWFILGVIPTIIALVYSLWVTEQVASWYTQNAPTATPPDQDIYDPAFLRQLFDEMQNSYERVCQISSLGFGRRWRKQLVARMRITPGMHVCDAMSGTGETWMYILPRIGPTGKLTAVDFSSAVADRARQRRRAIHMQSIAVLVEDGLRMSLPATSVDALVCAYGVKTLTPADQEHFAREIWRVLKEGGSFGMIEVSLPRYLLLRGPYMWYLSRIVPPIGRLLLGNPENYRMLSRYVANFKSCERLAGRYIAQGFAVDTHTFFGGCATALIGTKPAAETTAQPKSTPSPNDSRHAMD